MNHREIETEAQRLSALWIRSSVQAASQPTARPVAVTEKKWEPPPLPPVELRVGSGLTVFYGAVLKTILRKVGIVPVEMPAVFASRLRGAGLLELPSEGKDRTEVEVQQCLYREGPRLYLITTRIKMPWKTEVVVFVGSLTELRTLRLQDGQKK